MLTHVNVYGITIKLCIYQISFPQTTLGYSLLGINLCWHFTGSLIDISSSTSTLEMLVQNKLPVLWFDFCFLFIHFLIIQLQKVIKGRSSYQIILWYNSKTLLFPYSGNCKKMSSPLKISRINDYIFFVIAKDEMLEPEALKNRV